jgi:hypothetical protein
MEGLQQDPVESAAEPVKSSFDYDGCSCEEFIVKANQTFPWNKDYVEDFWEGFVPTDAALEDFNSEIENMVGAIERFQAEFHDTNLTDRWLQLVFRINQHSTKLAEYWSE